MKQASSSSDLRDFLRCFLPVFVPLALLLAGIMLLVGESMRRSGMLVVKAEEQEHVKMAQKAVTSDLRTAALDVKFLAGQPEVQRLVEHGYSDQSAVDGTIVDYQGVIRKGLYDEIRFLDANGMEIVRIDYTNGQADVVARERLQSKATRYYFREGMRLGRGGMYISPLDLTMENGQIVRPLKPTIRFVAPVCDRQQKTRGVVVLNYHAPEMLQALQESSGHRAQFLLVNSGGYWLKGLSAEDEWGFMLPDRSTRTFGNRFPEAWQQISTGESGQTRTDAGLFSFMTLRPLVECRVPNAKKIEASTGGSALEAWKLVSYLPTDGLEARVGYSRSTTTFGLIALEILIGVLSYRLAGHNLNRKRAQSELGQVHRQLELVLNAVGEGIHSFDENGRITFENPASSKMLGWNVNELIGKPAHPTIHHTRPDGAAYPQSECPIYACLNDGVTRRVTDEVFWRKDGSSFPVEYITTPVRDETGATRGAVVVFSDITERKRVVAELLQARKVADEANRTKSEFLANMSHEIRTPITAIVGFSEMMLDPDQSQSERFDGLQTIRRNAQHLLGLINDILDISKIEAGKMTVERIGCDLPLLLGEVMSMLQPRALEKSLQIRLVLDTPVPRTIQTDPLRLRQILVNLLGNAIKFTVGGQIETHITYPAAGGPLLFSVVDSGIGMTTGQIARLFQPFIQADGSTTRRFGGSGLGLTISKRLAELLGGDITVQSQAGKGSTFTASIDAGAVSGPLVTNLEDTMLQPKEMSAIGDIDSVKLGGRILLAEDGIDNQRFISAMLRKAGAEVIIAENGKIAVELVLSQSFDVVFMDMQMPEMDGYAAASKLRRRGCQLPIIALTAHAMAEDRSKCIQAGCTDYLTKPIDRVKLVRTALKYMTVSAVAKADAVAIAQAEAQAAVANAPPAPARLISAFADDSVMQEVLLEFVANLPSQVARMEQLIAAGDAAQLREMIHQMKGAGGSYGFGAITSMAAGVETRLKSGEPIEVIHGEVESLLRLLRSVDGYQPAAAFAEENDHANDPHDR